MPWNEETGKFDLKFNFRDDVIAGGELSDIESDRVMQQLEDLAAALDSLLVSSGRKAVGGNLDLNGFRFIDAGDAGDGSSYVTAKQAAGAAIDVGTFGGTANALTASQLFTPLPIPVGYEISGTAKFDSTGAVTYSHNAGTPLPLVDRYGVALLAGAIKAGDNIRLIYHEETVEEATVASWRLQTFSRREFDGAFYARATNPSTLPRTGNSGAVEYKTPALARTLLGLAQVSTTGSYTDLDGGIPDLETDRLVTGTARAAAPLDVSFAAMTTGERDHIYAALPDASDSVRGKLTPSDMATLEMIEPVLHDLGDGMSLTPGTIGSVTGGAEYSFAPEPDGGIAPYELFVVSGELPPGLVFDQESGTIAGIPQAPGGEFAFTIQVRDAKGALKDLPYTVVVEDPTIAFDNATSPDATAYRPYKHSVAAAIEPALTYNFQDNNHSFIVNSGSLTTGANGSVYEQAGADPQFISPTGLTINGAVSRYLRLDVERVTARTAGSWQGTVYYGTAGHTFAGGYYKAFPDLAVGDRRVFELDMSALNVGGDDWITNTITRLRFDFDSAGGASIRIHSIRVCDQPSVLDYTLASGVLPAGLSLNASTGEISGAPGAPGTGTTFTVRATDRGGYHQDQEYTIGVVAPSLSLEPTSISNKVRTIATSIAFTVSGNGTTPYQFERTSGTIPPGLTLDDATGILSGTPTTNGTFNFTILATDANGFTATRAYAVVVYTPSITLQPGTISPKPLNEPATVNLSVAGNGTEPYTYAVTSGALPFGLALDSGTGVISGTPTIAGTYNFTVTATDANGFTAARAYAVIVALSNITLTPTWLPGATGSTAYSQNVAGAGGTAPYSFAVTSGTLPPGMSLNVASGAITGTPIAAGTFNFSITATDANGFHGEQAYSITVAAPTIAITPTSLPSRIAGTAGYSESISASGGVGPYIFTKSAGTLPPGLALASNGALTGTPSTAGTYNFTVTATDANGFTGTRAYTVSIAAGPPIGSTRSATVTANAKNLGGGSFQQPSAVPAGSARVVSSGGYWQSQTTVPYHFASLGTDVAGQTWANSSGIDYTMSGSARTFYRVA